MKKNKKISKRLCHDILNLDIKYAKALAVLVITLASDIQAKSVVELSLNPLYTYQYSSIYKTAANLSKEKGLTTTSSELLQLCLAHCPNRRRVRLQTDVTPIVRPYSPSLEQRQFVKISNTVIRGNKPISIGYPISCVNISLEDAWSLPLQQQIVPVAQTASRFAVSQIQNLIPLLKKQLGADLIINTTDSGYTNPSYLADLYEQSNLVCISRLRYGSKVYLPAANNNPLGAKSVYGDCFYLLNHSRIATGVSGKNKQPYEKLQTSLHEHPHDDYLELSATTSKGRALKIVLHRWNDLKMRSKKGHCMKHKPFDVVAVRVVDANTGQIVFQKDLFVCIFGKRKAEISLKEAYWDYRHRFDIEVAFRFNKQQLFFQDYDCEKMEHQQNWLLINQLANWLLYYAADEVEWIPRKWDTKQQSKQVSTDKLSIAKTHKAAQQFFSTFDMAPFQPKSTNKGRGNPKKHRPKFKVVKKADLAA